MGGREQKHTMRNLFRMDDDSSASSHEDDHCDKGPKDATPQSLSASLTSTMTTITQTIHHVELEICSIGGSIEHRLWPAATFLTSYVLQPMVHTNNDMNCNNNDQRHHSTSNTTRNQIQANVQTMLGNFQHMISTHSETPISNPQGLKVLELGAGVGFTTLELAYHVFQANDINPTNDIEFLMTDLSSALPLLQRNRQRNFGVQNSSIQVQKLEWGNHEDIENALAWYKNSTHQNFSGKEIPLLIIGTDCVYWESLYDILEITIASLLQNATPNSICLLANVRRWKRDTNFFQHKFGQFTSTINGRLHCICIHEQVARNKSCDIDDPGCCTIECDQGSDSFEQLQEQREVIRIYAIQWITKHENK